MEVELRDSANFLVAENSIPYTAIFIVRPGWKDVCMINETTFEG